jgi:CDP-diacylglycerol--glycerol-3-phosphate 3-phosphatidyltransferase
VCDVLDGGLARRRGEESHFGAFIDSTLDRVSELALFGGILIYYTSRSVDYSTLTIVLVLVAMGSSMLVSYARARLEGLGYTCFVGWFERPERMAIMVVGLILGHVMLTLAIVVLAFGATWTVLQRIRHAHIVTRADTPPTEQTQSHQQ